VARVIVVGAGVLGLTCAVRLAEEGHRVDVVARDLPRETTSAIAAAFWSPPDAPAEAREVHWAARGYRAFAELSAEPASGVTLVAGTEVFATEQPEPSWGHVVPDLARETALPAGYVDGRTFTCPLIEMPIYLDWLGARLDALGGTITRMNLSALPPTGEAEGADIVLDCAGLGARLFAGDLSVAPVRGQVVVVEQVGLDRWWFDPATLTYVVPRSRDIVLGGSRSPGEWSRTPDPGTADDILDRAARLVPEVAGARVLRHRVGLRPARPEPRVERVGDVIHCYGHGGNGVTLSWGCADEVVGLVG
jgi:D-amino-acid oxidase